MFHRCCHGKCMQSYITYAHLKIMYTANISLYTTCINVNSAWVQSCHMLKHDGLHYSVTTLSIPWQLLWFCTKYTGSFCQLLKSALITSDAYQRWSNFVTTHIQDVSNEEVFL